MKIWKTIKWLLNSPPISLRNDIPKEARCDYCGIGPAPNSKNAPLWKTDNYCICEKCRKTVFDIVLKSDEISKDVTNEEQTKTTN